MFKSAFVVYRIVVEERDKKFKFLFKSNVDRVGHVG